MESGQIERRSVDQVLKLIATKAAEARDHFNELTLTAKPRSTPSDYPLDFPRVRRWCGIPLPRIRRCGPQDAARRLPMSPSSRSAGTIDCHGFNVGRVDSSHEGEFDPIKGSRIREHNLYDIPLVCRTGKNAFAIGEADLRDYGGLYLHGRGDGHAGVQTAACRSRVDDRRCSRGATSVRRAPVRRGA